MSEGSGCIFECLKIPGVSAKSQRHSADTVAITVQDWPSFRQSSIDRIILDYGANSWLSDAMDNDERCELRMYMNYGDLWLHHVPDHNPSLLGEVLHL